MEKLLITGVDGILGSNLATTFAEQFEVVGLYDSQPVELEGCLVESADGDPIAHLDQHRPDWVIHCGPHSRSSWEDIVASPELRYPQAERFALEMAEACAERSLPMTLMSTDAVFSGPRLFHDEQARPAGDCLLAQSARRLEQLMREFPVQIVRTHAFGWSPMVDDPGHAEFLWHTLAEGLPCKVDADRHATPILASDLAPLLLEAHQRQIRGILHITGAERTSPFRFAAILARAFGLSGRHIRLEANNGSYSTRRPFVQETSLNTRRARRLLNQPMPMLRDSLGRFAEQAANGYRAQVRASHSAELIVRSKAA
ncbi:dTDP-4-dehydrorhamnose reductase [Planctomycetales bacterium 10988]|nr:dTDP-4-dehydrorhamnose reductase [Planctomycetales bacterium 10988]